MPVIGPIYQHLISGHNILVYVALAAVPVTWWVLYRTRFGLRLRAVGENPGAVDTAGVSVVRLRYAAVLIAGLLCGIAGAYLSTGQSAGFVRDMTAGKGFIALAALIFAKWRPWPALGACLLFGFLEAVGIRYQGIVRAGRRHDSGAVHAGAALHPDRGDPRRLRRQGDPAEGRRPALRQGAVMRGASRSSAPAPAPSRWRSGWCSARASATWPTRSTAWRSTMPTCPDFPHAGVSGHNPRLVVGELEGVRVAVLGGRAHYYEQRRRRR